MVNLYFQPDAQMTVPDRMVMDILQKEYEQHKEPSGLKRESSSDSVDSAPVKHTRFEADTPEGTLPPTPNCDQRTQLLT